MNATNRIRHAHIVVACVLLLWTALQVHGGNHPSEVFVLMPTRAGALAEQRWVSAYGGDTWHLTQSGIMVLARSRGDSNKVAVAFTDFVPAGMPIRIEGADARAWPVRIYDEQRDDDVDVIPYGHLRVYGLSACDTCYLIVEPRGGELRLGWHGPVWSTPRFEQRGHDVVSRASVPHAVAFPALPSMWLKANAVQQEELWEPVMVTDPRVLFATYLEPEGVIGFDKRGDLLMSGQPPLMLDVIPITPELIDDSITTRFGRTTKLRPDRTPLWSVWVGGRAPTTMAQNRPRLSAFDRDNNLIVVQQSNIVRKLRSHGTYQESPEPNGDVFIVKWSPEGRLLWNTYVGGNASDIPQVVVTDDDGNIYVGGLTMSTNFPTPGGLIPMKPNHPGRQECFLFSLSPNGKTLRWGTYVGARDAEKPILDDNDHPDLRSHLTADFGDLLYDRNFGILVTMNMWRPTNFPLLNAWKSAPEGAHDGYLACLNTVGKLKWSTLITSPASEFPYSITSLNNGEILLRFNILGSGVSIIPAFQPIPTIGVPGYTHTLPGLGEFYMRFGINGQPTFLWAPMAERPRYSYMAAPEILISEPLGQDTLSPDAFSEVPRWWIGNEPTYYPTMSIARTPGHRGRVAEFVTPLFGTGIGDGSSAYYFSSNNDFIIAGASKNIRSRGACLTDTLWGAGFGTNTDTRAYAMCFRSPVSLATSIEDKTPTPAVANEKPLHLSPHPVGDVLHTNVLLVNAMVYDVLGATRLEYNGNGATTINVSMLAPGMYTLQAHAEDGTVFRRVFIKE